MSDPFVFEILAEKTCMRAPKGGAARFFVPREILRLFPNDGVLRNVLTAVTMMYCANRPPDRTVRTNLAEIAKASGWLPTPENLLLVESALEFLRAFPVPGREPLVEQKIEVTLEAWGFISFVAVEVLRNCREVKLRRRRVAVCLSEPYTQLLDGFLEGKR